MPATRLVPLILIVLAGLLTAAPAAAQMHQNGVMREGPVLQSRAGGTAFMCRTACTLEGGCQGWSWTRAGADGPQASCRLLSGVTASQADPCCESGELRGPAAAQIALPDIEGDRYASRATRPDGPPVDISADAAAALWGNGAEEDEESAAEDSEEPAPPASNEAQPEQPEMVRSARRGPPTGGRPTYSVQREYTPAPVAQAGGGTVR